MNTQVARSSKQKIVTGFSPNPQTETKSEERTKEKNAVPSATAGVGCVNVYRGRQKTVSF